MYCSRITRPNVAWKERTSERVLNTIEVRHDCVVAFLGLSLKDTHHIGAVSELPGDEPPVITASTVG